MIGEIISDKYKIEAPLSESHIYEVFTALEVKTGATVVLKILKEEMAVNAQRVQNFSNEIRSFASISHPLIAEILDIDMFEDRPYVVTELVTGKDMHSILRREVMSFSESVKILQDLATVLQHAADEKVAPRTIKHSNVLRDDKGNIKVLAFTHPRLKLAGKSSTSESSGVHSDLFFLGTTFYEMLAGESPIRKRGGINELWDMKLEKQLRIRHSSLTPEQIHGVVDFVRKTLTRNMKQRFSNHEEFLKGLADLSGTIRGSSIRKKTRQLSMASQVVDALNGRMSNVNVSLPAAKKMVSAAMQTVNSLSAECENSSQEGGQACVIEGNLAVAPASLESATDEKQAMPARKGKVVPFPKQKKKEIWDENEESHWLKSPIIFMGSSLVLMILLILFW